MQTKPPPDSEPASVPGGTPPQDEPIDSNALFQGRRELVISHNHVRYVLRITRQGKLILNK